MYLRLILIAVFSASTNKIFFLNSSGLTIELSHEDFDAYVDANSARDQFSKLWHCSLCSHQCLHKLDMSRHIESKHVNLPELNCDVCGKASKTRNSLRMHMKNYHSIN